MQKYSCNINNKRCHIIGYFLFLTFYLELSLFCVLTLSFWYYILTFSLYWSKTLWIRLFSISFLGSSLVQWLLRKLPCRMICPNMFPFHFCIILNKRLFSCTTLNTSLVFLSVQLILSILFEHNIANASNHSLLLCILVHVSLVATIQSSNCPPWSRFVFNILEVCDWMCKSKIVYTLLYFHSWIKKFKIIKSHLKRILSETKCMDTISYSHTVETFVIKVVNVYMLLCYFFTFFQVPYFYYDPPKRLSDLRNKRLLLGNLLDA